jgi:hypothetical protein
LIERSLPKEVQIRRVEVILIGKTISWVERFPFPAQPSYRLFVIVSDIPQPNQFPLACQAALQNKDASQYEGSEGPERQ